uniref:Uncharacterized protein n=1 Tax=Haptolina ericina TaxID=156174 RepID=A0A7S3BJA9_9EUKA
MSHDTVPRVLYSYMYRTEHTTEQPLLFYHISSRVDEPPQHRLVEDQLIPLRSPECGTVDHIRVRAAREQQRTGSERQLRHGEARRQHRRLLKQIDEPKEEAYHHECGEEERACGHSMQRSRLLLPQLK